MNIDIIEKIKNIRSAIYNNKLVVFVGAGGSKNSNLPTWGELITKLAKLLSYEKCDFCSMRDSSCPKKGCKYRYQFSQDEYLKIPQYYYESKGKSAYKRIIRSQLNVPCESNAINDIIFRMLPHHIITTNYDHLLENSKEPNARLYSVIREDKDLILSNNTRYIIKMHGDIDNIDKIVLKENDYLEYSQNHVLIETYIKSLLIDHVFLFIGYSLNDYNLKLIISWINYLAKEHESDSFRPCNYIIQSYDKSKQKSIYEQNNLAANNVITINSNEIPDSILSKAKDISLSDVGKKVYSCLEYILQKPAPSLNQQKIIAATVWLRKVVFLAIKEAPKKWTMPARDWAMAYSQIMIFFEDRFAA